MKGLLHGTYGTKVGAKGLLLDIFPGARVAYSFRKLRRGYTGPCIRLQNDSNLLETDVGFVNDYLDVEFCKSFLRGATRGYVVKWYDQSGNGNDGTLTGASPPSGMTIYVNGINYRNNRVVGRQESGGNLGYYAFTSFSAITDWAAFIVQKRNAAGQHGWYFGSTGRGVLTGGQWNDNNIYHQVVRSTGAGNGTLRTQGDNTTTYVLYTSLYVISPLVGDIYKNGIAFNLSSSTFNPTSTVFNTLGRYDSGNNPIGDVAEAILYTKNMTGADKEINDNLIRFYGLEYRVPN